MPHHVQAQIGSAVVVATSQGPPLTAVFLPSAPAAAFELARTEFGKRRPELLFWRLAMLDGLRRQWPPSVARRRRRQMEWMGLAAAVSFLLPRRSKCPPRASLYLQGRSADMVGIGSRQVGRPMCLAMQDCNGERASGGRRPGKEIFPLRLTLRTCAMTAPCQQRHGQKIDPSCCACGFAMNAEEPLPLRAWMKRGHALAGRYFGSSYPSASRTQSHCRLGTKAPSLAFRNTTA